MCKNIVIVGTGAGGATAARDLSLTKNNVVMLEKGNHYQPGDAVNHIINKKVISNSPLSKKRIFLFRNHISYNFIQFNRY